MTKADLEAMLGEFELVEHYGGTSAAVDVHLDQLRRNAAFGVSLEEWARTQGVSLAYARALQRFLDQGEGRAGVLRGSGLFPPARK